VAATATAIFATRRDTWAAAELAPPSLPPAEAVAVTPSPARVAWTDRYEMRFVEGGWPDFQHPAAAADSRSALWIRDEPPRPLDAPALAAICDAFYPRVFRRRGAFAPAGTVSMTVHFHADAAALAAQGSRPVLGVACGQRFTQGFFDQRAEVWGSGGLLLASSQQSVYFKG
jgi:Thioesterase-like superfamily